MVLSENQIQLIKEEIESVLDEVVLNALEDKDIKDRFRAIIQSAGIELTEIARLFSEAMAQVRDMRKKSTAHGLDERKKRDPKKGTGKKPKGSGRRLYTDEDPSDTVSVSFKSVSAIQKTLSKKSFKSKSHKRQSQIINLIHQRARAAYRNAKDPKTKARLKRAFEYAKKRKEASKRKTVRLRKKKK